MRPRAVVLGRTLIAHEWFIRRKVVALFTRIGNVLNDDAYPDTHFQLFRSEQRAIGELVIIDGKEADRCIGYAEFCARLGSDPEFAAWFSRPSDSVVRLAALPGPQKRRFRLNHVGPPEE